MKKISLIILLIGSFNVAAQTTEIKKHSFRSNPKKTGGSKYSIVFYEREDKTANTLIVDSIALEKADGGRLQMIKGFEMEPHHPSYIEYIDSDPHFTISDFNFDSLLDLRLINNTGMGNRSHHYWLFDKASQKLVYDSFLSSLTSSEFDANEKTVSSASTLGYQRYYILKYRLVDDRWTTIATEKMEWIEDRKKYKQTIETLMPDGSWQTEVSEVDN